MYKEINVSYAGFWKRLAAYILDFLILIIPLVVFGGFLGFLIVADAQTEQEIETAMLTAEGTGNLLGLLIGWIYYAVMESSAKQATLGKLALGIKVTDLNGSRISFGRASGRYFAKILSGLLLGIGFLMVAFTSKKQGLHDMIAGTLVVNK